MTKGVLDLFSGAGGASLGVHQVEGLKVIGAVDIDQDACDVYNENFPLKPWTQDLTEVSYHDILDHFDIRDEDVDIVIGCPPCQNFSSLRDTEPWPDEEPRDELLRAFLRLIDESRPPMVFFENVPGFITKDDGKYVDKLENWMDDNRYGFSLDLVNTADYGVPQGRRRTIGIGVRGAEHHHVEVPTPTHARKEKAAESKLLPHRTVADTIDMDWLPELKRGERDDSDDAHRARRHHDSTMKIIRSIPKDGGSRSDLPEELVLECHKKVGTSAGNVYGRMSWSEPAPTLTTRCTTPSCGRFLHPDQDRSITFREAALLMGFPRNFVLPDRNDVAERVVGNAVPPALIKSILRRSFSLIDEIAELPSIGQ